MKYIVIAAMAAALLCGCAQKVAVPREGGIIHGPVPQGLDQCYAQPWLDWCKGVDGVNGAPKVKK